jgi:hypothetical protein
MNYIRRTARKGVGRPPRLQSMVVMVLQGHPKLQGHPSDIARYIQETSPSFEGVKGNNVSIAFSKLRRRFGEFFDPRDLHADQYHVERLVLADDGERVCPGCGATSGYQRPPSATPLDEGLRGQNSFVNPLHRALRANPIRYPGTTYGVISKVAVTTAEFGDGVEGRLLEKAFKGFEELCKCNRRYELPQEITSQITMMIEADCKSRARSLHGARTDEAQQAIITSCVRAMEKFPHYERALRRMILNASAYFPDLTSTPKRRRQKSRSSFMLEEEERTSRRVENEEG